MRFIDLEAQQRRIAPELKRRIEGVLAHGQYIMGPEVEELESRLAEFAGAPHCVSCASGTDALFMILMAMGIGPGDAVFTTPFTFMATAEVIGLVGATPVFVDVRPDSYNLDPAALDETLSHWSGASSRAAGSPTALKAAAILAVDLYGLPADYPAIRDVAARHGVPVVADAAQSFGAGIESVRVGALAPVTSTSFFPAKPLGCYGDGGAIFTEDAGLADALRSLRVHGRGDHKYHTVRLGTNSRLDTLQAGILLAKMDVFEEELARRQEVAQRYEEALASTVQTPVVPDGWTSAWAQYAVIVDDRDAVRRRLAERDIPSMDYYPIPLHRQPVFEDLHYAEGSLPVAEDLARRVLCLPMHPYLEPSDQSRVIDGLGEALLEQAR